MNSSFWSFPARRGARITAGGFAAAVAAFLFTGAGAAHDGFGDLVEELIPSVVSITVQSERARSGPQRQFHEFFDRYMPSPDGDVPRREPPRRITQSVGSGFFISEDGYIVTNAHVIDGATSIEVELSDLKTFEADVIGADPNTDIAVLKIDAGDQVLPALPFGDSDDMRVGDHVLAIGNPLGLDFSVSAGIVSGRNRTLTGGYDDYIQTDAAINSGNSGGPLFNMEGEVVGVNTLYLNSGQARSGGSTGIGFAMASAVVEDVADQLIQYGTTRRGWLGIGMQTVTSDIADAIGLESDNGILVNNLLDGPAGDAGVEIGDVITAFDGVPITDSRDMLRKVADAGVGTEVDLTLTRRGGPITVSVILGSREEAEGQRIVPASRIEEPKEGNALGLELGELDDERRQALGLDADELGLIVLNVEGSSLAFNEGIRQGDLILQVNSLPVETIKDVTDAVAEAEGAGRDSVLVYVKRGNGLMYVALPIS